MRKLFGEKIHGFSCLFTYHQQTSAIQENTFGMSVCKYMIKFLTLTQTFKIVFLFYYVINSFINFRINGFLLMRKLFGEKIYGFSCLFTFHQQTSAIQENTFGMSVCKYMMKLLTLSFHTSVWGKIQPSYCLSL